MIGITNWTFLLLHDITSGKDNICFQKKKKNFVSHMLRDWSLITGRGVQNGKIAGPELFVPPPPSRQGKTFHAPVLKSGNILGPPFDVAATSTYYVKTTPNLFVSPLQHG